MARNGVCYGAKDQIMKDQRPGLMNFSPVVLTSNQEDALTNRKVWNSGYKLWKLKSSQPHLFANQQRLLREAGAATAGASVVPGALGGPPPGFERVAPGWLYHIEKQLFFEEATNRTLWLDKRGAVTREFAAGEDLSSELALSGAATAAGSASSSSSSSAAAAKGAGASAAAVAPAAAATATNAARHAVIMDLHKAADMFKLDWLHMDKPAAMLAVYKRADGAVAPEIAAKGMHEKILRRFAAHRAAWSPEQLSAGLVSCMEEVASEQKAVAGIAGCVALILGSQLVVAASHGASCVVADSLPGDMKDVRVAVASSGSSSSSSSAPGSAGTAAGAAAATAGVGDVSAACVRLDARSAECVLLHTEACDEQAARIAAGHAERGRPRASAARLLASADARLSRAAACAHLAWAASADPDDGRSAKRARTEKAGDRPSVRCRHILLKYVGCTKAVDTVRRKPVRRTVAEAEAMLVGVLDAMQEAFVEGGQSAAEAVFTRQVRALSECQTSLRGGDLAGDVGWLKMPEIKPGEKLAKDVAQRLPVIRAAIALSVNEVSDIVVAEDGVRLLKRTA
eukprot:TRINITY_DN14394_c0_g2_i1.p1 TRINITY_DN14394_c0_g2~~TRINITY_DN14394_c0_g2_i1.p1  ORF type:complete len:570 (-),score=149.66 TRINITY_DN14394_c0_g2_i1:141-1850(-)